MRRRLFAILLIDFVVLVLAWRLAFGLRFNFEIPSLFETVYWATLPIVVVLQIALLMGLGVYSRIWRYVSIPDLKRIGLATTLGVIAAFLLKQGLPELVVPRSVWLIYLLAVWVGLGGVRLAVRVLVEERSKIQKKPSSSQTHVLVIGAGSAGLNLVRDLLKSSEWKVVGILDDDSSKWGRRLYGVKIWGATDKIAEVAVATSATSVILALPSATYSQRSRILKLCREVDGLQALTVPSLNEIMHGEIALSKLKKLDIDSLLGRSPVDLDLKNVSNLLSNKTILVTGAGGSIGSELCRQLKAFGPKKLILIEKSEPALYQIEQEFLSLAPELKFVSLLADVQNSSRMSWILNNYRPQIVFHAAAYKHVPLVEENNNWEAIRNNSWGSYNVAQLCASAGVETFVMISTDKAVRPSNVMGASKRLAEILIQGLAEKAPQTRFITVRFGNVLGSQGSVIPKFKKQLLEGGPLTVTHPDMERFFMSIPEATQLVIQAAAMGRDKEIFVLEMGTPIKLLDLARDMIRLSGLSEEAIGIEFTGLRPGEKLFEELFNANETPQPTSHPKIRIAKAHGVDADTYQKIIDFVQSSDHFDDHVVTAMLRNFVEGYQAFINNKDNSKNVN